MSDLLPHRWRSSGPYMLDLAMNEGQSLIASVSSSLAPKPLRQAKAAHLPRRCQANPDTVLVGERSRTDTGGNIAVYCYAPCKLQRLQRVASGIWIENVAAIQDIILTVIDAPDRGRSCGFKHFIAPHISSHRMDHACRVLQSIGTYAKLTVELHRVFTTRCDVF